jgi:outer membrane lipoprotein-sorting protein
MARRHSLVVVFLVVLSAAGCVRDVRVPPQLRLQPRLTLPHIVDRIKRYGDVQEISAPVTLRFRDLRGAATGKNKEYPAANGRLILSRPERIRLVVTAPIIGKRIADMVSNGEKFRLKVLWPEDKRKFIRGSNAGRYKRIEGEGQSSDPALQQAGTLANIRPQHLTDAFLVKPLELDGADTVYFLDEVPRTERDTRSGAKERAEVTRTYYVLTLLERIDGGPEVRVQRKLWFDRTRPGTPLARYEIYEEGRAATVVTYDEHMTLEGGRTWPGRVRIERVVDDYSVDVLFERSGIEINGGIPETAFELENEENLEIIDLDQLPGVADPTRPAGS